MAELLNVLYIGSDAGGRGFKAIAKTQGWETYLPESINEALGMYIFYAPHLIVFEGDTLLAQNAFEHLSEVAYASPRYVEAMLVLSDDVVWDAPEGAVLSQISCCAEPPEVFMAVRQLLRAREDAVYERQYAPIEAL
ncbi:MAG: hypothetical protein BroJett018_50080 [Chloroflexota bacterium]|nr:hypothetical protein [Chloroflexota bacterium]NOG64386.1 hypothetical protein [Chloroflexota bacterium]GIK67214.1 MAG: hypothetical protein BroJett018_50080 [Chloroflexota bacterium]